MQNIPPVDHSPVPWLIMGIITLVLVLATFANFDERLTVIEKHLGLSSPTPWGDTVKGMFAKPPSNAPSK